ncbi:unnamed protein product, partial [Meganyctiphanes norvegica]
YLYMHLSGLHMCIQGSKCVTTTEVMQLLILLFALMNRAQATSERRSGCGPDHAHFCPESDGTAERGDYQNDIEINNGEIINGQEAFEGDIVLTEEQKILVEEEFKEWYDEEYIKNDFSEGRSINRKAERNPNARWPEGNDNYPLVPYIFVIGVDNDTITAALDHWMEKTCIVFWPMNDTFDVTQPHLRFIKDSGCWSYVGMMLWERKGQPISIGNGCETIGIVAHEVGHAIGFWHEQSRSDRDDNVVINFNHIRNGSERNFAKRNDINFSVPYDYSSDMHYGSNFFTKDGHMTIATLDVMNQGILGRRTGLSHRDALLANYMYGCTDKWLAQCNISKNPCENEGYIGKNCFCVCPQHATGKHCENVDGHYYSHLLSGKNEVIEQETIINAEMSGDRFVKKIRAPQGHLPRIEFTQFKLHHRSGNICYWEVFNIRRNGDLYDGEIYCGTEIAVGQVFDSTSRDVYIYSMSKHFGRSQWEAKVTFISDNKTTMSPPSTNQPPSTTNPTPNAVACEKRFKASYYMQQNESIMFSSPNYPEEYPSWTSCKLLLKTKPKLHALWWVTCSDFHLEARDGHKCVDYLQVNHKRFYGLKGPNEYVVNSTSLNFIFRSNNVNNYSGFLCNITMTYRFCDGE